MTHLPLAIESLEYHVTHSCNLTCQQCSHYSNFRLGGMLTVAQARQEYALWAHRLQPRSFALLGGEPSLNPELVDHVRLAREVWPRSRLLLVSNGFYLERHPELPQALVDADCTFDISKHGDDPAYNAQFAAGWEIVNQWQAAYPKLRVHLRQSHQGWMRQYRVIDGVPMPFRSDPAAAFRVCMQKSCTQLYQGKLWKCPALAYFGLFAKKLKLENVQEWQLFKDYAPCPPDCSDDDVRAFFAHNEIPQCRLCPCAREAFQHPSPVLKDGRLL